MELSAREDIEIPLNDLFAKLSDFRKLEKMAIRRGADVQRLDDREEPEPGMSWRASFTFRGKRREANIRLVEFDAPQRMSFATQVGGLESDVVLDLVALSRTRTRLNLTAELKPKTLSARLLVQSLKLARGRVERKLRRRLSNMARDIEEGRI